MSENICSKCHNWKSEKCDKNMAGGVFGVVTFCGGYKPLTNADRIRSMSDMELSEFIKAFPPCDCCINGRKCSERDNFVKCRNGILEWLQKPAK